MDKIKLIAAFIVALTLIAALFVGAMITKLLYQLPSPWGDITVNLFCLAMLTWGIYLYLSKPEKKDNDEKN